MNWSSVICLERTRSNCSSGVAAGPHSFMSVTALAGSHRRRWVDQDDIEFLPRAFQEAAPVVDDQGRIGRGKDARSVLVIIGEQPGQAGYKFRGSFRDSPGRY